MPHPAWGMRSSSKISMTGMSSSRRLALGRARCMRLGGPLSSGASGPQSSIDTVLFSPFHVRRRGVVRARRLHDGACKTVQPAAGAAADCAATSGSLRAPYAIPRRASARPSSPLYLRCRKTRRIFQRLAVASQRPWRPEPKSVLPPPCSLRPAQIAGAVPAMVPARRRSRLRSAWCAAPGRRRARRRRRRHRRRRCPPSPAAPRSAGSCAPPRGSGRPG